MQMPSKSINWFFPPCLQVLTPFCPILLRLLLTIRRLYDKFSTRPLFRYCHLSDSPNCLAHKLKTYPFLVQLRESNEVSKNVSVIVNFEGWLEIFAGNGQLWLTWVVGVILEMFFVRSRRDLELLRLWVAVISNFNFCGCSNFCLDSYNIMDSYNII